MKSHCVWKFIFTCSHRSRVVVPAQHTIISSNAPAFFLSSLIPSRTVFPQVDSVHVLSFQA